MKKPWFKEALLLYIIYLVAKNESLQQVTAWKELAHKEGYPYIQDRAGQKSFIHHRTNYAARRRRRTRFE